MQLTNVTVKEAFAACVNNKNIILDVRTVAQYVQGAATGAVCMEFSDLNELALTKLSKEINYYIMCQRGKVSVQAISQLRKLGFNNLYHIDAGYDEWLKQKLPTEIPTETPKANTHDLRYLRHHQLPGFGRIAQNKLQKAHILQIGAGGLGSSCGLYLAAAGVGQITIIDDDVVQLSNLQRQIIHTTDSINTLKVASAKQQLLSLNPEITINAIAARLDKNNVDKLVENADIIIDGSDNLSTRYMVNDSCIKYHKPLVYAALYQYEAQISVFNLQQPDAPCLRCLFPQTKGFEPDNCSTAGVLGVVPGLAGIMQASEAIKLITKVGEVLTGKLLICDLLDNSFRTIKYAKANSCPKH
ncbi:Molybdopterin-synthase adenylyltransferase [hydrothermal vent metagenome]|uniref:Molybdopterin-synthase adenylyltransferase n=1 Tax=hydrothermal vent metagenome TaxID=652676 RepID=A0A3B0VPE6_9ZZZZ